MNGYLDRLKLAFWVIVALVALAAIDFPLIGAWARTLLVLTAILAASLIGTATAAATTAAALPAVVLSTVTVLVGVASAAFAYRALPQVVEVAKEHPWEAVSPAVAAVAYFPGDVLRVPEALGDQPLPREHELREAFLRYRPERSEHRFGDFRTRVWLLVPPKESVNLVEKNDKWPATAS